MDRRGGYAAAMDIVVWEERPVLSNPIAVVAFEGWGDAGSAASMAAGYLVDELAGFRFASIDPDEFFDFQVRRPHVMLDEFGRRRIDWPDIVFHALSVPGLDRDLVVVTGDEPHARWKVFSGAVGDTLAAVGVTEVLTLGAFIGQVPHTLPVPVIGVTEREEMLEEYQLFPSDYEGPTGIVGVLNQTLQSRAMSVTSLWAAVPHYLSNQDYPPGGLALLDKVLDIAGIRLDTSSLAGEAADFRGQVDLAVKDSDLESYVEDLEAETLTGDGDVDPGERLVEEIERFLNEG